MVLQVYGWDQCPHTRHAVECLKEHNIPFDYHEIEEESRNVIEKVIDVNGGDDWVVPTLEYNGKWRPGEVFNPEKLEKDLKILGVIP